MNKLTTILIVAFCMGLLFSCTENKTSTPKKNNNTTEENSVAIPMHGTKENSSSSTNQRFEMNEELKQSIQQEKSNSN
ncbi:hypothetical protein [Myroides injenensis]|uniref:hypothetical protein n=1 Tax=Myroides injenensis TaxID=1183151 RepID=UPI0002896A8F|nr:hypothetical protein [Myroides injenensis]